MRLILAAALCWSLALAAQESAPPEPVLPQFKLRYDVSWGGMDLGDAQVTLEAQGAPGCYRYRSVTQPIGIVRMFYGAPSETSEFCVVDGRVVPRRFEFRNPKDEDASFALEFDAAARTVKSSRGEVRPLPDNAQDRFGLHQAVRLWLIANAGKADPGSVDFTLVEDGRNKLYRFAITGRETLRIPAGKVDTLVIERVNDRRKTTRFWIAPARDWMPVKVERIKDGRVQFSMVLSS